ncbi:proteasome subunit beta [Candidatus Woesearchaeota archaeon CG10_big_fil_rev_8_21_14_0_10_34_8]|nr:MAG: proteasome subunit beta [Candidatus Woesearchaeota archaeon CG10_big_fil_rev_8_21_14_0_10_34_8]
MGEEKYLKTGTTTIAMVCKDGLVLAADKRATAGNLIANKKTEKIQQIADTMALTMAGTVSDAQLLTKLIKAELQLKKIRLGRNPTVKEGANLLATMVYGNIRRMSMIPGIAHFIVGGSDDTGYYVYDIYPDGSITLIDDFIASGSGSVMAFGVLETLYTKTLSITEGIELAVKALNAAMQRDSASGNGAMIVTITKRGLEKVFDQNIEGYLKLK